MDPQHIAAFNRARTSEYLAAEENCQKLNKFIEDYEAVKSSLTSLSEKCRHPVTVPFGNVAFMRGSLVHTNDILVLLGDNWFVEQSAKQTVDILSRRVVTLRSQVDNLQARMQQINTELDYAKELVEENGDTVEIVEPCDEQAEQSWKMQHEASLRKHRQEAKDSPSSTADDPSCSDTAEYERIWRRLEELEKAEEEEQEADSDDNDDDEVVSDIELAAKGGPSCHRDSLETAQDQREPLVINFKHSVSGFQIRERQATICSPADIYDRFRPSCSAASVDTESLDQVEMTQHLLGSSAESSDSKSSGMQQSSAAIGDVSSTSVETTGKKVSKFKASRLKK